MINVKIVSGYLGSEYTWGIKTYIKNLTENMPKNVRIDVIENSSGILRYLKKPGFIKDISEDDIVHLGSQTFGYVTKFMKCHIATCHDMMAFSRPDLFDSRKQALMSRIAIKGMKKCGVIIAVSQFTKDQVINFLGVDDEKVDVIHSGISRDFRPGKKKDDTEYIIYFGSEEKRKNVTTLIEAFKKVKSEHPGLKLVKNYSNPDVWKKICSMKLEKDVIITGNITRDQMAQYYTNAKAFVYPSLFEGFGFTPLEAMACGCPVVSSNAAAMPEILGDAAVYSNPLDANEMADKISMILDDARYSRKLSRKSSIRAKKFSWKTTAKKTKKIYEEVS